MRTKGTPLLQNIGSSDVSARILFAVVLGVISGFIGEIYAAIFYSNQTQDYFQGFRTGFSIGLLTSLFEVVYIRSVRRSWFRRLAFVPSLIIRILILTLIVRVCLVSNDLLTDYLTDVPLGFDRNLRAETRDTLVSLGLVVFFVAQLQFTSLIGFQRFNNLLIGRYFRPVSEERIFMFVDLVDSSVTARRLGDVRFHEFLSEFFHQIDRAIVRNDGEIVSYVGDAVILTWPLKANADQNSACLKTLQLMQEQLESQRQFFETEFGTFPLFTAALHCGPVVVGECGDSRRQVTFLGDVVNMTARIEQACKEEKVALMASETAVSRIATIDGISFRKHGLKELKGADKPFTLFEIVSAN